MHVQYITSLNKCIFIIYQFGVFKIFVAIFNQSEALVKTNKCFFIAFLFANLKEKSFCGNFLHCIAMSAVL